MYENQSNIVPRWFLEYVHNNIFSPFQMSISHFFVGLCVKNSIKSITIALLVLYLSSGASNLSEICHLPSIMHSFQHIFFLQILDSWLLCSQFSCYFLLLSPAFFVWRFSAFEHAIRFNYSFISFSLLFRSSFFHTFRFAFHFFYQSFRQFFFRFNTIAKHTSTLTRTIKAKIIFLP